MADEIARVCGPREADGYLRFVAFARELWQLERDDFIARNLDTPLDLLRPDLLRLSAAGGFRTARAARSASSSRTPARSGSSPSRPCTPGWRRSRRSPSTR